MFNLFKMRMLSIVQVIRRDLTKALRRKRSGMEIEEIIYHHDNAPSHRAADTLETIDFLGMERLEHAHYSPDLAPIDFALFPRFRTIIVVFLLDMYIHLCLLHV